MDQDLTWWRQVVFERWDERPGPRYERLAVAVVDAVDAGLLEAGAVVPAERALAETLRVSRGTVVAALERLVEAGVVVRRQGARTTVRGRPAWTRGPASSAVASLLVRRAATHHETIDLSLSVPSGTGHLPAIDWSVDPGPTAGAGLHPRGHPHLRDAIARHLTTRQRIPSTADEILVTSGAHQALTLLGRALLRPTTTVVAACPNYPGLSSALPVDDERRAAIPVDGAGMDPVATDRALERAHDAVVVVMAGGHNPTGVVMTDARRRALLEAAERTGATVIDDLTLTDLVMDPEARSTPPLAARAGRVVAVGSASKLLWAGLRVGWIRAAPDVVETLAAFKADDDLGTSVPAQLLAARLLDAIDDDWLAEHRRALTERRDHLHGLIREQLPAWRPHRPAAGLSLWAELPVRDASAFAVVAASHGIVVAPGAASCVCGRHRDAIRLSFAEPLAVLDLAVERMASAWEIHCQELAAT